jgi:hypothetical protein
VQDREHDIEQASSTLNSLQKPAATPSPLRVKKWRWALLLCLLLAVAITVGLVVGLKQRHDDNWEWENADNDQNEDDENNESYKFDNALELRDLLETRSPRVLNEGTAQNQAYQWMITSGIHRKEEGEAYLWEKYALATLYYSTNGIQVPNGNSSPSSRTWVNSNGWLDDSITLCDWYPGTLCVPQRRREQQGGGGGGGGGGQSGGNGGGDGDGKGSPDDFDDKDKNNDDPNRSFSITTLNLTSIQLDGALPEELSFLTDLEMLLLDDNPLLTGTLIDSFGKLEELEHFSARRVGLTGSFPSTLSQLEKLQSFQMQNVPRMAGAPFPTDLWTLSKLKTLSFIGMGLIGGLPEGGPASPHEAYLRGNALSGPLPKWGQGDWGHLKVLDLRNNALTGTIPTGLSNLWASNLSVLRLEGNALTGTVRPVVCTAFTEQGSQFFGADPVLCVSPGIVCPCCTLCNDSDN